MCPMEAQAHQHGIDITKEVEDFVGYDSALFMDSFTRKKAIVDWEVAKKLAELKEV